MADEKKESGRRRFPVVTVTIGAVVVVLTALVYLSGIPALLHYLTAPRSDIALTHTIQVEDVEYLNHDGTPLLATVYRPEQAGPYPLLVAAHGGGWITGTRLNDDNLYRLLADRGIAVLALDFRTGRTARYPQSIADVHFGIRWAKANAERLGTRPDWVGAMGSSTGGHIMALVTMRPNDPRYASIQAPGVGSDPTVPYVVELWPVINPLGRYNYLQSAPPAVPWIIRQVGIMGHNSYWGSEEAMAEGSPVVALEQGEQLTMPDILYVQNEHDVIHPSADRERFVAAYSRAGGNVDQQLFTGAGYNTLVEDPASAEAQRGLNLIVNFVNAHTTERVQTR
jgi:acetyl esterase